jgi:hypothetical protein
MTAGAGAHVRRRRGRDDGPEARLDELFRPEPEPEPEPDAGGGRPAPWLVRSALQAFAASAVVYTLFHVVDLAAPYPIILAVCVGAVLVRRSVMAMAEPVSLRTRDVIRPPEEMRRVDPAGWREGWDGMTVAIQRWDQRLDRGSSAPERFQVVVAPRLGDIADERLRQRHGLTRASDPARARALLGDELWIMLHEESRRVPTVREVAAAIRRLEHL